VFCCDIDKTGQFAVTGGEDDLAYVWDLRTGEVKLTCKDNSVRLLWSNK
jgi:angio-associated migratory cell protein